MLGPANSGDSKQEVKDKKKDDKQKQGDKQKQADKQDGKVVATIDADIISHYVWRGQDRGMFSIQPTAEVSWRGLFARVEGSTGIRAEEVQEIDLWLGYRLGGFNIGVADYWATGLDIDDRYFYYDSEKGAHQFEANVGYSCRYFSLQAYTIFGGRDFKLNGDRAYSTYIELGIPFRLGSLDWQLTAGMTPMESAGSWQDVTRNAEVSSEREVNMRVWDYAEGPACVQASLRCTKELNLGKMQLPVFAELNTNPYLKKAHLIFGLSIKPW
jgi:hypothetical protein